MCSSRLFKDAENMLTLLARELQMFKRKKGPNIIMSTSENDENMQIKQKTSEIEEERELDNFALLSDRQKSKLYLEIKKK